ncbi:cyclic nucleotide-binding domain-containing protein [Streptomyces pinistramenti]|uniref:cyclic nucleotide-binding domain-containing protein n=1 Tax=Streptomyces pinistramenti TaxID=2884812 RepID=UPI001D07327F|nr:cyclic nucleotide-binding domain-containing protein [Streptomyces pinistramenti]MCB5911831.1 cyclic nucleotide-binding domain-containing protein [Streptomyces pinistramenti]
MTIATRLLTTLAPAHRDRLMTLAREALFDQDTRIFEERGIADRFWVLRSGSVSLDLKVPGRRRVTVATLGPGDLLGWSWLFPPHEWDFGAEAFSPVRAYEFDADAVRALCEEEPALGFALVRLITEILAHRLEATRAKLVEQCAVHHGVTP